MANIFESLNVVQNGTGAPTAIDGMGTNKTIQVNGEFTGSLTIQIACDAGGPWAPVKTLAQPDNVELPFAASHVRVVSKGAKTNAAWSPVVQVGANDAGGLFGVIPAPPVDGEGASLDVSAWGLFTTFVVGGDWEGVIGIQISQDGVEWSELLTLQPSDKKWQAISVIANEIRAVSRGGNALNHSPLLAAGATNDPASGGAAAESFLGFFGDGSDGDVVLSGDVTLRTEVWYENLDMNGFDIIGCNRVFVRDTLIVRAGSIISRNGASASGPSGGATKLATITGVGGGGGDEQVNGTNVTTHGYGGDGGAGGASPGPNTPGTGGVSSGGDDAQQTQPRQCHEIVSARTTGRFTGGAYDRWGGGGGGGGGEGTGAEPPGDQDGGGGGSGGDVLVVSARNIVIEAGGIIEANGGNGAAGETPINPATLGTGGGGGGGGGLVLICYETLVNNGTIQALGGNGGAGGGLGSPGQDGEAGNVFMLKTTPP
jgi:hypothetical protein